tara:strand:- start:1563 stop:2027 length:465 start_codon:yes stop_codon:yes gene_type:complete
MTRDNQINPKEIEIFLTSWKDGVLAIGKAYHEADNYKDKASAFIEKHYAFDTGDVLFKPTYTTDVIFRNNPEAALSYFVTGSISEDSGFAIKPWESIKVSDTSFLLEDNLNAVMGVLNLTLKNSKDVTKIAFTFILVKNNDELKIKIHHSSELI